MKGELDDEAEVYDTRIAGRRLRNWASSNSSAHARKWFAGSRHIRAMGIRDRPTAPRSPWQNGYPQRLIGSI